MSTMTDEEKEFVDKVLTEQEARTNENTEPMKEQLLWPNGSTIEQPEGDKTPDVNFLFNKAIEGLEMFKKTLPMAEEYMKLNAILTKAKYDALVDQGLPKHRL